MTTPYFVDRVRWCGDQGPEAYKIRRYIGTGTAEEFSNTHWPTEQEAQAAADRCNAGDESGISFGSYSSSWD